mmetsp:Transcript_17763/g.55190  ORF Transcript_17763/g.55190 Transcript_17763/m.55190 type:complete len:225 (-) Transcript_17763:250-924(-)
MLVALLPGAVAIARHKVRQRRAGDLGSEVRVQPEEIPVQQPVCGRQWQQEHRQRERQEKQVGYAPRLVVPPPRAREEPEPASHQPLGDVVRVDDAQPRALRHRLQESLLGPDRRRRPLAALGVRPALPAAQPRGAVRLAHRYKAALGPVQRPRRHAVTERRHAEVLPAQVRAHLGPAGRRPRRRQQQHALRAEHPPAPRARHHHHAELPARVCLPGQLCCYLCC